MKKEQLEEIKTKLKEENIGFEELKNITDELMTMSEEETKIKFLTDDIDYLKQHTSALYHWISKLEDQLNELKTKRIN